VSETEEFSDSFVGTGPFFPGPEPEKMAVVRYIGKREKPRWIDLEPGKCSISTMD